MLSVYYQMLFKGFWVDSLEIILTNKKNWIWGIEKENLNTYNKNLLWIFFKKQKKKKIKLKNAHQADKLVLQKFWCAKSFNTKLCSNMKEKEEHFIRHEKKIFNFNFHDAAIIRLISISIWVSDRRCHGRSNINN